MNAAPAILKTASPPDPREALRAEMLATNEAEKVKFAIAPAPVYGPDEMEGFEPVVKPWPKLSSLALPGFIGDFVGLSTENSEADQIGRAHV